ncbi:Xanthine/uracil/thiamine/ascorbate permease family protein [Olavius algarvensis spirochete endosymbiont]|uniref:NCS2 family permease n=1 Tax=Olavius algarvensis spirochete endosymbiont TaxID=260710 RepID=UPI000F0EE3E9|nr:NCS2 family permease [Olavius algarvensis spirochete endosymbiont]CAD7838574.1 MAG: Xanthine/uracil/thiamine/ascorbate permease family protein [Olavius algarvensis spirochete endosymbiont]VDA99788.1 Xanthine/uracil/thiamine/ascorbate permease family protein [Olavius algarvensis spirochete endosymbiont]
MKSFFAIKESGSKVRTEILAGITTFLTMAYILAVNPDILSNAGLPKDSVFMATAVASAVATLVMALVARLPFALAPGMGLNTFFAFTVVLGMGKSWQFALTAVLLEGIIFLLLTALNVREAIINSIPANVKKSISVGIGLFIAFIGLQKSGLIVSNDTTLVQLGELGSPTAILSIAGLVVIAVLLAFKVKGALLLGIIVVTVIGIPLDITKVEGFKLFQPLPSMAPTFFKFVGWNQIFSMEMLVVLFTFLFVDMFDTVGTLIGVSTKARILRPDGSIPRVKQALFADAIGTTVGAMLGTSTVTTYIESAAGVEEGGRTGLTALVTAILFLVAVFLSPLFLLVPSAATAPALILVGLFMMSPVIEIEWGDVTEALPAFLAIIMMPLAYSIAEGIVWGVLSYILVKVLSGKVRDVSLVTYIVGIVFVLSLFV